MARRAALAPQMLAALCGAALHGAASCSAALFGAALFSASAPARVLAADAPAATKAAAVPLLVCLETIARAYHVRIVDSTGESASLVCAEPEPRQALEQAMDRLLQPRGLAWRRLDDGTLEVFIAAHAPPTSMQLPALDIEGDPVAESPRLDTALATPLVEHASATTTLNKQWLDTAPLLGFNQLNWYAPNVYGSGQSLAIRGTERDSDYFPALTVTFDGIELGTRLLDDELVPLEDVTNLKLARGPRSFEYGEGSQAGVIALKTAAPAAEPTASMALGAGNLEARDAAISWSGPLWNSGVAATIALDRHELPSFVRQVAVPQANIEKRRNDFGRLKLTYTPESSSGFSAQLAALALSGDSSERQIIAPVPVPGQPAPPTFDPFDRDSYALQPVTAQTHARGAAAYARYDQADRWAIDAHASATTISRDVTEFPNDLNWTDQEFRRRAGVTVSDHPAAGWTLLAALEDDHMSTSLYTPISSRQVVFNYFATTTESASLWAEHAFGSSWNVGLGARWLYEQTTVFATAGRGYAYHVPIPLAVVEWHPWTDQVFSLSYGTGYRTGGQVNSGSFSYSPERSQNVELSWRAQWFGGALHTTATAFDGRVHDRFTYDVSNAAGDPILGSARDRGVELEFDAELSQQWRLRGGFGVLSSRFSSAVFREGDTTSQAPPQTATLGVRYGAAQGWYGALDAYHAAAAQYYNPNGRLPAYEVVSFRLGYRWNRYEAALLAANALDEAYAERIQLSAANQNGYRLGDPRRVELLLKATW